LDIDLPVNAVRRGASLSVDEQRSTKTPSIGRVTDKICASSRDYRRPDSCWEPTIRRSGSWRCSI